MLVSCSHCSGLHKRGSACAKRIARKKPSNDIRRFRSSRVWRTKSEEIRKRDRFLCQYCLLDKKYNFKDLEVHHIYSIASNWNDRLENLNLITLCKTCHKKAELDEIPIPELLKLSEKSQAVFDMH